MGGATNGQMPPQLPGQAFANFAMPPPGLRATTMNGPQQVGGGPQQVGGPQQLGTYGNPAPWLHQQTGNLPPLRPGPQLGAGQQQVIAQQQQLAQQLRDQGAQAAAQRHEQASVQPTAPALTPDQQAAGMTNAEDPYNFGPDYSDFYEKAHGAGSYGAEAKRFADLDKSNQLGSYESQYGEFPEDPAEMEQWFRRAGEGGARTAGMQDMVAQNKRTDLTEAGIMALLAAGMGAAAGGAAAAGASTPIPLGVGGATFNTTAPLIGAASTVAGGLAGVGGADYPVSLAAQRAQLLRMGQQQPDPNYSAGY